MHLLSRTTLFLLSACIPITALRLAYVGEATDDPSLYPLLECEGDCDGDKQCDLGLSCFHRNSNETVPHCFGKSQYAKDYCFRPEPQEKVLVLNGLGGKPETAYPLDECQGACQTDEDCKFGLSCMLERQRDEEVKGCSGGGIDGVPYCYRPPTGVLVKVGDGGMPTSAFPLGNCQGECDTDNDCERGLSCYFRRDDRKVPHCDGTGISGQDYCHRPQENRLVFMADEGKPINAFPLKSCQGDCDRNDDCDAGLWCFQRREGATDSVPGCRGEGIGGMDYCFDPEHLFQNQGGAGSGTQPSPTYVPGQTSVVQHGLILSTGLTAKLIAKTNETVRFKGGMESKDVMHEDPDGGAVFPDPSTGGWIYVSNAETSRGGGVGAISFDSNGNVIDYKRVLDNTRRNCGGGKTWWGTWLSCEEVEGGQVWEVDPSGKVKGRQTLIGGEGDKYESAAYDNRDKKKPKFFITTDSADGPVLMFSPDDDAVIRALSTNDYSELLHTPGKTQYLVLKPDPTGDQGTFFWSNRIERGRASASAHYQNSEGIDVRNGKIYLTCKKEKFLFILDINDLTYVRSSTKSGTFDGSPDQVARLVGNKDLLFFCEEGGESCGVHARDSQGRFYTILEKYKPEEACETTGLAFSPDDKHLYVSFQEDGKIFDVTRLDGEPFGGQRLDIKYHAM